MIFLLTLNTFYNFFYCFCYWLWTGKYVLGLCKTSRSNSEKFIRDKTIFMFKQSCTFIKNTLFNEYIDKDIKQKVLHVFSLQF